MRINFGGIILFFLILIPVYPNSGGKYKVIKDNVNIRADSTSFSEIIGVLNKDQEVDVLEEKYDWYKIRLPKNFTCYVKSDFIERLDKNKGKVVASSLNLRIAPTLDSFILGKVKKNDLVYILEENNGWLKIKGYPYLKGWVYKSFLRKVEEEIFVAEGQIIQLQQPRCKTNYIFKSKENYPIKISLKKCAKFLDKKVKIVATKKKDDCVYLLLQKLCFVPKK